MHIKIEGQEPIKENVEVSNEPQAELIPDGVLFTERVAQMFDLKPSELGPVKGKLNTLIEYAKTQTEDKSVEGIKWALRTLSIKLGTPPMGEKLINYMHRFAFLSLEGAKIDAEREKFLNGYNR